MTNAALFTRDVPTYSFKIEADGVRIVAHNERAGDDVGHVTFEARRLRNDTRVGQLYPLYFGGHDGVYAEWIGKNQLTGPPALEFVDRIWLTYVARRSGGLRWLHDVAPIQTQTYLAQLLSNPSLIQPGDNVLVACREHAVTGDGMQLDHGDLLQTALEMVLTAGDA